MFELLQLPRVKSDLPRRLLATRLRTGWKTSENPARPLGPAGQDSAAVEPDRMTASPDSVQRRMEAESVVADRPEEMAESGNQMSRRTRSPVRRHACVITKRRALQLAP